MLRYWFSFAHFRITFFSVKGLNMRISKFKFFFFFILKLYRVNITYNKNIHVMPETTCLTRDTVLQALLQEQAFIWNKKKKLTPVNFGKFRHEICEKSIPLQIIKRKNP